MSVVDFTAVPSTFPQSGLRLLAYDHRALLEIAERRPWSDGLALARARADRLGDIRPAGCGFGVGEGEDRRFDPDRLFRLQDRLARAEGRLGGARPLRHLLGDYPGKPILLAPTYDGWALYEDLTRLLCESVSEVWSEAQLLGRGGMHSLLGPLGRAVRQDLRLAPYSPACAREAKPYPPTWRDKPRARIYHVTDGYLHWLERIGRDEVWLAARESKREEKEVGRAVGRLLAHFEHAQRMQLTVAVDPDHSFWS